MSVKRILKESEIEVCNAVTALERGGGKKNDYTADIQTTRMFLGKPG